jgi:hypothetical protein
MYKIFFIAAILLQQIIYAQIPNPSFENWTDGEPDGWFTPNVPGFLTVVEQTTDAHSGSFAVRGEVKSLSGFNIPPAITPAEGEEPGIPISVRYYSLSGYFKFFPVEGDQLTISVGMYKNGNLIGYGGGYISATTSNYTYFAENITYITEEIPDTLILMITICGVGGTIDLSFHAGTVYYADDLAVSTNPVSVDDNGSKLNLFSLKQNYPNPFNPTTKIKFTLPHSSYSGDEQGVRSVTLKVYDILGNEVASLLNEELAPGIYEVEFSVGSFGNAADLSSGVYFYQLQAGDFIETKKMVLMR